MPIQQFMKIPPRQSLLFHNITHERFLFWGIAPTGLLLAFSPLAICQTLPTAGKWQRQQWSGITGGRVSALTSSPAFYLAPGSTTLSDSAYSYLGDNYGARTRGYITPAVTGLYTFWVCGDDEAQLYLAADGMKWSAAKIAGDIYPTNLSSYYVPCRNDPPVATCAPGSPATSNCCTRTNCCGITLRVAWAVQPALASAVQNWATPDSIHVHESILFGQLMANLKKGDIVLGGGEVHGITRLSDHFV